MTKSSRRFRHWCAGRTMNSGVGGSRRAGSSRSCATVGISGAPPSRAFRSTPSSCRIATRNSCTSGLVSLRGCGRSNGMSLGFRGPRRQHHDPVSQVNASPRHGNQHDRVALLLEDTEQFIAHAQIRQRIERRDGSSMYRISGFTANARASSARFSIPPEISWG